MASSAPDPPNADISFLEGGNLTQIVVVLQDPVLNGDDLTYTVKVLQGDMPAKGSEASVFIDIIGRPLAPMSFAGVAQHLRGRFHDKTSNRLHDRGHRPGLRPLPMSALLLGRTDNVEEMPIA